MMINCSYKEDKEYKPYNISIEPYIDSVSSTSQLESYYRFLKEDSIKKEFIFKTSYKFYKQNDSINFKYWNNRSKLFSQSKNDTLGIAESYWDLGNFYYYNNLKDSSYYYYNKAYKYYNRVNAPFYAGRMLLNMAIMQSEVRDYTGSEVTTVNAIKLLKPLKKHKQLYMSYNNLGVVFNGMNEYDKAIEYHEKALFHINNMGENISLASSFNNIGVVYQNMKDYDSANKYFDKALQEQDLLKTDPRLYAMVLDNMAYNNMMMGRVTGVEGELKKSLILRDSLEHLSGMAINYIHLGEYYLTIEKDTALAIEYFKKSSKVSLMDNNYRDLLSSLLFLMKIDSSQENEHLRQYIKIRDSLGAEERAIRNKFTRIKFETDQFIQENKELSYRQQLLIIGFSTLLIMLTLIYIIRSQRINNKKLVLEKQQKEANEEIYNLLLAQKRKIEEGKEKEKFRISSELHDGVLSKLFGIRMTLESLNEDSDPDSVQIRYLNIDELQKLESEIRDISHDLANNDDGNEVDLIEIIQEFINDKERISGIKISIDVDRTIVWSTINNKIKIHFYRIIQELVFNAVKYSEAQNIIIIFRSTREEIQLKIIDDGKGFDTKKTKKGIGIKNVYTRAADLKGKVDIESNSSGTNFTIEIPQ